AAGRELRGRYLNAVRDWARAGASSRFTQPPEAAARQMPGADPDERLAEAHFRLAAYLRSRGASAAAQRSFAEAGRLAPRRFAYQRQARVLADPATVGEIDMGLIDALDSAGIERYYPPLDLDGPPPG
ncbi:MAG: redoxin domain-containing (seleno)protein, partial [Acidimicrobiia bacterium]